MGSWAAMVVGVSSPPVRDGGGRKPTPVVAPARGGGERGELPRAHAHGSGGGVGQSSLAPAVTPLLCAVAVAEGGDPLRPRSRLRVAAVIRVELPPRPWSRWQR
jgi:hypothetical protein